MGYRRVDFEVHWRNASVGLFRQRLSDVRWLVGTFEPVETEEASAFLAAVNSLPAERYKGEMLARGVPVRFAKSGGRSRSRLGLVEYFGSPRILKKDISKEMVICIYNSAEVLTILSKQANYVWVEGKADA